MVNAAPAVKAVLPPLASAAAAAVEKPAPPVRVVLPPLAVEAPAAVVNVASPDAAGSRRRTNNAAHSDSPEFVLVPVNVTVTVPDPDETGHSHTYIAASLPDVVPLADSSSVTVPNVIPDPDTANEPTSAVSSGNAA